MEHFPDETVAKARAIAQEYKNRWNSRREWAAALFANAFLEIGYGFDDAIKSGRCGHFLHQVRKDADCFSYAGINYIIARELGLEPKLYEATDMRDVEYGEDPLEQMVANHCFISVRLDGEEHALDKMMGVFGKMKVEENKISISKVDTDSASRKIPLERTFSSLSVLSEEDYVTEMLDHQSPKNARFTLSSGQRVRVRHKPVMIQYIPEENLLVSSGYYRYNPPIVEKHIANDLVLELSAPLGGDGAWEIERGQVNMFLAQSTGWMREQHTIPHLMVSLPYQIVKQFLENLETAARYNGRKTGIDKLRSHDSEGYFENRGFSPLGEVISENGVDRAGHQRLLDEIVESIHFEEEPAAVIDDIHQSASYLAESLRRRFADNPSGLVYPVEARQAFIEEHVRDVREDFVKFVDVAYNEFLAASGLIGCQKKYERQRMTLMNKNDELKRFKQYLDDRKDSMREFDHAVDFGLYQREHPLGSVRANESEITDFYMNYVFENMVSLAWILPRLELKGYLPGIKRIFSQA